MSRSKRNIPESRRKNIARNYKFDDDGNFVGEKTPWQDNKVCLHKHMDSTRGGRKYSIGHGGINCNCCVKLPPEKLKIAIRRYERRKNKQNLSDD